MNLEKARELLQPRTRFCSGDSRDAAKLILAEIRHKHAQQAAYRLIIDPKLEDYFGFKPGKQIII